MMAADHSKRDLSMGVVACDIKRDLSTVEAADYFKKHLSMIEDDNIK